MGRRGADGGERAWSHAISIALLPRGVAAVETAAVTTLVEIGHARGDAASE